MSAHETICDGDKIIHGPKIVTPFVEGLGSTVFKKMSENSEIVAQIDGLTGQSETYGELLQRCIRAAIKLRDKGVKPKDVIVSCSFNTLNSFVPIIASLFLSAIPANLDPTISLTDTVQLLKQVSPKMVFVGPESVDLINDAINKLKINPEIVRFDQFNDFLTLSDREKSFSPVTVTDVKETAMIFFSSGTTGLPKAICLSHLGLLGPRDPQVDKHKPKKHLIVLNFASTYWISTTLTFLNGLDHKTARLVFPKFCLDSVWNLLDTFRVDILFLPPSYALELIKSGKPAYATLTNLLFVIVGGSSISKEQLLAIQRVLEKPVAIAYGLTELSGAGLNIHPRSSDPKTIMQKLDSIGIPMPGYSYKVVDLDTKETLGTHQRGELRIKTEFVMNGYYKLDSSTQWDCDGFLKTGDIVYYDEEYSFFFVDRCKELIKYRSWHVAPAKLESILMQHPAVQNAVVIAIPHPEDGDHPMGVVSLIDSAKGEVTEKEIEKYVEERVDERQKLRGGVRIVKNIPLTPTGKTMRRQVKEEVLGENLFLSKPISKF